MFTSTRLLLHNDVFDTLFGEALVNEDYRLFGRKLKPFCSYYEFWLENIDSPFIRGGAIESDDLVMFFKICRLKFLQSPSLNKIDLLRAALCNKQKGFNTVSKYMKDYYSPPQFWSKPEVTTGGSKGAMPSICNTITRCMALGIPHEEAWMMPVGLAKWYAAAHTQISGGDLNFQTQNERNFMSELKKRKEKSYGKTA